MSEITKSSDEKFCIECGNLIRMKAEICPKCGCRQPDILSLVKKQYDSTSKPHWSTLTSFISGIIVFIMVLTEPSGQWDGGTAVFGIILGILPVIFGIISFSEGKHGRWMGITGLVLGILVVLISIGSM